MENIINFFKNIITFLGDILDYLNPTTEKFILKGVIEFLSNILDYLNPTSENFILNGVINFIINILDYLNPFSDNFILKGVIEFLRNMLDYLNPSSENFLGIKLMELLGNLFEKLFIPSEERLTAISETITSKFGFIDTIKETINSIENILNNIGNAPALSIDVDSKYYSGEVTYLDLSWYSQFKPYGDVVLTGFIYIIFIWRLFVHAPGIIQGSSGLASIIDINEDKGD